MLMAWTHRLASMAGPASEVIRPMRAVREKRRRACCGSKDVVRPSQFGAKLRRPSGEAVLRKRGIREDE